MVDFFIAFALSYGIPETWNLINRFYGWKNDPNRVRVTHDCIDEDEIFSYLKTHKDDIEKIIGDITKETIFDVKQVKKEIEEIQKTFKTNKKDKQKKKGRIQISFGGKNNKQY